MTMARKREEPEDLGLWYSAIDSKPEYYDYSENIFGEDWEIPFELTDEEMEAEEFTPMMNYRYPLPDFHHKIGKMSEEEIKRALDDAGNITLIFDDKNEEYYLALTGAGMDFSWDIVQAYINLGYYPPTHFCDLPKMAGMELTPKREKSLQACRNSLIGMRHRVENGLDRLDSIEDFLLDETRKRRRR